MNIFFLTETESGCYKWRSAIPAKYLQKRGHTVQIFSEDAQHAAPDVLVFFRVNFRKTEKLLSWAKQRGIRVVFDTDDALDLVPRESVHHSSAQEGLPIWNFLLATADVVTTTTPTLAEHLQKFNPNVAVLPNSVDPDEWQPVERKNGGTRVGWTGGAAHFVDLGVALDAARDAQKKHKFKLILQGICGHPTIQGFYDHNAAISGRRFTESAPGKAMKRFLEKLEGVDYEYHPAVRVEEHAQKVCDLALDIGIAPLVDDSFNRYKSCIKYYEYAMSGAVTLASHVLPYSTEVPITAKNNKGWWTQRILELLDADRDRMWREQRDWVLEHRNMEKNVALWEQAYTA